MVKLFGRGQDSKDQLAHVTEGMYRQNLELVESNKTLTILRQIDEVVLGPTTEVNKVAQMITDLLVKDSDFSLAILYVKDGQPDSLRIRGLSSQAPTTSETLKVINEKLPVLSSKMAGQNDPAAAANIKQVVALQGLNNLFPNLESEVETVLKSNLNYQALFSCSLVATDGMIGALLLGMPIKHEDVSEYQNGLIERLTGAISIAVENHILYAELQAATQTLKVQNQKLKELDESKDEFISMASHQLGTPLTAVKGYLSLIMDGSVGPITENEKKYIKKAFFSAQKMVYLITDLLNVSRLQTGRFVIENKPTDLATMVEQELEQVEDQAASKQISLTYHKPPNCPMLNLDETKIRQVVMNFLDNAVYYTPKGGKVVVELQITPQTVNYLVTDTGIGVPKEMQPNLFGKFYRAENARKVRPDGTGLGLFMAKKVIDAQGGAIIFGSTEGQGSTFGFSFSRTKTEIPRPAIN